VNRPTIRAVGPGAARTVLTSPTGLEDVSIYHAVTLSGGRSVAGPRGSSLTGDLLLRLLLLVVVLLLVALSGSVCGE